MKRYIAIAAIFALAVGLSYVSLKKPAANFGGGIPLYAYDSNEAKLIRYFSKQELNKGQSAWESNPNVQKVRNQDGTLNMQAVKNLFVERQIMTAQEFDTAYATIKTTYLQADNKPTAEAITEFQNEKATQDAIVSTMFANQTQ